MSSWGLIDIATHLASQITKNIWHFQAKNAPNVETFIPSAILNLQDNTGWHSKST